MVEETKQKARFSGAGDQHRSQRGREKEQKDSRGGVVVVSGKAHARTSMRAHGLRGMRVGKQPSFHPCFSLSYSRIITRAFDERGERTGRRTHSTKRQKGEGHLFNLPQDKEKSYT